MTLWMAVSVFYSVYRPIILIQVWSWFFIERHHRIKIYSLSKTLTESLQNLWYDERENHQVIWSERNSRGTFANKLLFMYKLISTCRSILVCLVCMCDTPAGNFAGWKETVYLPADMRCLMFIPHATFSYQHCFTHKQTLTATWEIHAQRSLTR